MLGLEDPWDHQYVFLLNCFNSDLILNCVQNIFYRESVDYRGHLDTEMDIKAMLVVSFKICVFFDWMLKIILFLSGRPGSHGSKGEFQIKLHFIFNFLNLKESPGIKYRMKNLTRLSKAMFWNWFKTELYKARPD